MKGSFVAGLLALGVVAGCDQGGGFVHGEHLALDDCGDRQSWDPFDMPLTFLGVIRAEEVVMLRASTTSQWADNTDSLLIHIASHAQVQARLAEGGSATLDVAAGDVSVGLSLMGQCPQSRTPLVAQGGTVTLSSFGTVVGDQITADLVFDLLDQRTGEVVGQGFEGSLDFEVSAGTPFELFSDVSRQHGE